VIKNMQQIVSTQMKLQYKNLKIISNQSAVGQFNAKTVSS